MSDPNKPSRMIVSLQVGGFFFALANVVCVAILAWAWLSVKLEPKTLSVTGSARKQIDSDRVTWSATVTARDAQLTAAYGKLKEDMDRVAAFLKQAGIDEKDITVTQIATSKVFAKQAMTQPAVNGVAQPPHMVETDQVKTYVLSQSVTISSADMKRAPEASRTVTSLIKDNIEIESSTPMYLYTKLSELKIDMLAEATKDATARASQIVTNANGHLGRLVEARMGVMQINPRGSSATSGEGNNDTTSFEKEITAVVSARFELK
ncbi:MAG: SIMPL domain-containing protein [Planctomycetota bacterium]|nr:SIMPL domain-containing protein [Planctomycetota bacterium]